MGLNQFSLWENFLASRNCRNKDCNLWGCLKFFRVIDCVLMVAMMIWFCIYQQWCNMDWCGDMTGMHYSYWECSLFLATAESVNVSRYLYTRLQPQHSSLLCVHCTFIEAWYHVIWLWNVHVATKYKQAVIYNVYFPACVCNVLIAPATEGRPGWVESDCLLLTYGSHMHV